MRPSSLVSYQRNPFSGADQEVDQPPGTGYSFIPTNNYLHELHQVGSAEHRCSTPTDGQGSAHLIQFLQNFYHIFPDLSGVDVSRLVIVPYDAEQQTYLAGESYAGQYIPYFGQPIVGHGSRC